MTSLERINRYVSIIASAIGCPDYIGPHADAAPYCNNGRDCYCLIAARSIHDLETAERIIIPIKD